MLFRSYQKEHSGEGKSRSELAAEYNATKPAKATNNTGKVHGNSLDTDLPAEGYTLRDRDTGEILKYGETTRGEKRYTQKYLDENNANYFTEAHGTKKEMHYWQHEKILDYMYVADQRPPLNKSTW